MMFGFFVSLLAITYFHIADQILFVIITCFFSIFPDIDSPNSRIGKKAGIISDAINFLFDHRGLAHSVLIPLAISITLASLGMWVFGTAVLLGYGSHLLLDTLTNQGIMPLYPLMSKSISGFFKSDGVMNHALFFVFLALSGYVLVRSYLGV